MRSKDRLLFSLEKETKKAYPKDLFAPEKRVESLERPRSKHRGYLRDALSRFFKDRSSIVGFSLLSILVLFGVLTPLISPKNHVSEADFPSGFQDPSFRYASPYNPLFAGTGFWDGTKEETVSESQYLFYLHDDSNHPRMRFLSKNVDVLDFGSTHIESLTYTIRRDTYAIGNRVLLLSKERYAALLSYEEKKGIAEKQNGIRKPLVDSEGYLAQYEKELAKKSVDNYQSIVDQMRNFYNQNPDVSLALTAYNAKKGSYSQDVFFPVYDENGEPERIYLHDEDGSLSYSEPIADEVRVRVDYFDYFEFRYGFAPRFVFGTNGQGQDIFLRLAKGLDFSLLFGIVITLVNVLLGVLWGSVAGFYGGEIDLFMQRLTDIISGVPSIILLTICQIQFVNNLSLKAAIGSGGVMLLAIFVAFVYNGWIGVSGMTRMQFYRFKRSEYVLASRSLGAGDARLIFRHILPNSLGTLLTSSILMVPGVIYGESSLSYLGLIDFQSSGFSSIGTLLNEGQAAGLESYSFVLLFPALCIAILMICFNLFGNGLRDAFNRAAGGER